MNLSSFFSQQSATAGNIPTDVYAKVSKIMQAQNTAAPKLNAALRADQATLSGLGQLKSALTTFQGTAQALREPVPGSSAPVAQDPLQLAQAVANLVSGLNTLNARLNALRQGELKQDGTAASAQSALAHVVGADATAHGGTAAFALAQVGIVAQDHGDLTIDTAKLQAAIAADAGGVARLFSDAGQGIADKLVSQIQGLLGAAGSLSRKTTAVNQDIAALNAKRSSLEKALTRQASALVQFYSQQDLQGDTSGGASSSGLSNRRLSLFNFLK